MRKDQERKQTKLKEDKEGNKEVESYVIYKINKSFK
jgi:hypothetical protein